MSFIAPIPSFGSQVSSMLGWEKLPSLPDAEGFAGSFAGSHNGALIVAGGANFPDKRPWEGGAKIWYDSVFVLEHLEGQWKTGFKLPRPLGYGVSITCKDGVLCVGGSSAEGHHPEVLLLKWERGRVHATSLKNLPKPCANMCGALVKNTVYVAGGIEKPDSTNALKTFWALDLAKPEAGWRELEPWPGPGRMFAVAAARNGNFYLFGGAGLSAGPDLKPVRKWLRDAYCFVPGQGWRTLPDLPHPVVAAPSPAPVVGDSVLLLGGDDGAQVAVAPTEHKGFPRKVLSYSCRSNSWSTVGTLPFSLVTTACANWRGKIIIPGGEKRPGARSTEVWAGSVDNCKSQ